MAEGVVCFVCLDSEGLLPSPLCACRGTKGAHLLCLVEAARHCWPDLSDWHECRMCKEAFVGHARMGLAQALWGQVQDLPDGDVQRLHAKDILPDAYHGAGRYKRAEDLHREVLAAFRATLGDQHRDTLASISRLGKSLRAQGKLGEAKVLFQEDLAACRATLGDQHPDTLVSISTLGQLLRAQGKLGEAEVLIKEALAARRATLGDRHPNTLVSINSLGGLLHSQGKLSEAEVLLREALQARRATLGDRHPDTLHTINSLGELLRAQG